MMYKRVLITGGCGFVGSNIAIRYKKNHPNTKVISLDNLNRKGSELNVDRLEQNGIIFYRGDVRNHSDLESLDKIDLIIECSAECSVLAGYHSSPRYLLDTNLLGAINCLELAKKHRSDFIFLSTSRIYPIEKINSLKYIEKETRYDLESNQSVSGVSKNGFSEVFSLDGIRSFYGATKLGVELILQEYIHGYGIKGIIDRCGVLAGPWQMGKIDQGFISLWIARHIYEKKLSYIGFGGQGKQVRDVLHVDDLFDVIEIQLREIDKHNGKVYNIGGGYDNSVSLKELTSLCEEITGKKMHIGSIPETREADVIYYISDYSKFNRITEWTPKRDIKKIVEDINIWLSDNKEILREIF